jgi:hypothetical protein
MEKVEEKIIKNKPQHLFKPIPYLNSKTLPKPIKKEDLFNEIKISKSLDK